jgi:hypothetical protein
VRSFEQAWDLYDQQQADQVVDAFSNAGMPTFSPLQLSSLWQTHKAVAALKLYQARPSISPLIADQSRTSGTPPPETLYKFLQRILNQNGVSFMVAPYSAAAQVNIQHIFFCLDTVD